MNNKLLIISQMFYPDTFGGTEKVLYYQIKELKKAGYEITVLARKNKDELHEEDFIDGVKVIRYTHWLNKFWGKSLTDIFILPKLIIKTCADNDFDQVVVNNTFAAYGYFKSKVPLPYIYLFHASYALELIVEGLERKIKIVSNIITKLWSGQIKKMEQKALAKAEKIIVYSDFSSKLLKDEFELDMNKVRVIPLAVDLDQFKPIEEKKGVRSGLSLPKHRFIILTVRRLVARTGVENLIKAAKKLAKDYPDFLLLIGGRGVLEEKLKKMIRDSNLKKNIRFLGYISDEDLPRYYQSADLFVLPTFAYEGFGLVTLESMASGTPVLGTPVGATPEILNKFNPDYLFKSAEPEDIYQGLKSYLDNRRKIPVNLSEQLRDFVELNYNWEKHGKLLINEI